MSTTSEVKSSVDEIALRIVQARNGLESGKGAILQASAALQAIPEDFADTLQTVQEYVGDDAFEALAKSEVQRLTSEFVAIRGTIDALKNCPEFNA